MEFEFDPKKSVTNEQKHGISFTDAQALWDDPDLLLLFCQSMTTLGKRDPVTV